MAQSLNLKADLRVMRTEARNALDPFIAEATELLRVKHERDARQGITQRHVNAIPEVRALVLESFEALRLMNGEE